MRSPDLRGHGYKKYNNSHPLVLQGSKSCPIPKAYMRSRSFFEEVKAKPYGAFHILVSIGNLKVDLAISAVDDIEIRYVDKGLLIVTQETDAKVDICESRRSPLRCGGESTAIS